MKKKLAESLIMRRILFPTEIVLFSLLLHFLLVLELISVSNNPSESLHLSQTIRFLEKVTSEKTVVSFEGYEEEWNGSYGFYQQKEFIPFSVVLLTT